jgi:hypothetical protein
MDAMKLPKLVLTILLLAVVAFAQGIQNAPAATDSTNPQSTPQKAAPQGSSASKKAPGQIHAGPVYLDVQRFDRNTIVNVSVLAGLFTFGAKFSFNKNGDPQNVNIAASSLSELQAQIADQGFDTQLVPEKSGSTLLLKLKGSDSGQSVNVNGDVNAQPETAAPKGHLVSTPTPECHCDQQPTTQTFPFSPATPDYTVTLAKTSSDELTRLNDDRIKNKKEPLNVYVRVDGDIYDLENNSAWQLDGRAKPVGVLVIGNQSDPLCDNGVSNTFDGIASNACHREFTLARRIQQEDIVLATSFDIPVRGAGTAGFTAQGANQSFLVIEKNDPGYGVLDDSEQFVLINGKRLNPSYGPFRFDLSYGVKLSIYRNRDECRLFSHNDYDWASLSFYPPTPPSAGSRADNGIMVAPGKIFDTLVLKRMLSDTASQLASISGFSSVPITNAFGNFQGVTRDVSFLSAQVTTTPLPTVASTIANGTTGNSGTTNTTPIAGMPGTVTIQCPDGSLPTIGSGGLQQCTAVSGVSGSSSTVTTTPAGTSQQVLGTTNNQQNSQTTTSGGFAPTVPTAPASTALSPPTNIGVSSSDILTEQVQLNSQITTLRLLLQGAASDQYLSSDSRAVATRQQTTLGFSISIDPPRQYKHAVADVRIIIVPPPGRDGVSIMTLLPAEKTYNVAKVTSHQNQFGAGVTVQPVSVGVSTGKSKDRLYLAKDTDTIALQYPEPRISEQNPVPLPFWHKAHDAIVGGVNLNPFDPCTPLSAPTKGSVAFGWQFRPVLGADYVKGGQRQVFAQLALPAGLNETYVPTVYVQTLWRAYDSKRQVLGPVYKNGCSVNTDTSGIELLNPLIVRDLNVTDIGNGQVRLTGKGSFLSSGMTVRSGLTNVTPTAFDGTNIETFATVHDVLQTGDLSLVSQNGVKQPFAIVTDPGKVGRCGITEADILAVPRPDGNAYVHLHMKLGSGYALPDESDGQPQPFVLIGTQVYGVQESPFVRSPGCIRGASRSAEPDCNYFFLAPTNSLRNAESFLVQDIAWDSLKKRGTIDFAPAFDKLTISATYPTDDPFDDSQGAQKTKAQATDETLFAVSGFDFGKLDTSDACNPSEKNYCLRLFVGSGDNGAYGITIASQNLATFRFSAGDLGKAKAISFRVFRKPVNEASIGPDLPIQWDLQIPKTDDSATKPSISPAYLFKSDSQTVTVTGGGIDFSLVKDVKFDGKIIFTPDKPSATELKFLVSTDVTKSVGRKEFTIDLVGKDGKPSTSTISVDVVLR